MEINGYPVQRIEWWRGGPAERAWIGRCIVDRGEEAFDRWVVWSLAADDPQNQANISAFWGHYTSSFAQALDAYEAKH